MPIYEFACQDCGHEFEKIQSFSDSTTPSCPNCQGLHVQRRLSTPAIHFKGSGWYITDSKKAAKGSATGSAGGSAESEADKGDSSKADAGKGDGGKADGGKADGGKADGDKSGKGETKKGEAPGAGTKGDAPAAAPAATKAAD